MTDDELLAAALGNPGAEARRRAPARESRRAASATAGRATGERSRAAAAAAVGPAADPLPDRPSVLSADELESIHVASLRVLTEIGMDFLDEGARDLLGAAGADVEPGTQRVRFDPRHGRRADQDRARRSSPSTPRTPSTTSRSAATGRRSGRSRSAPNVADLDRGRRIGNRADYQNLIRLCQMLNPVHFFAGYPVEPIDIHASIRHLDALWDLLTLADKPIHAYSLGRQRITDAIEMARIARGIDQDDPRPRAVAVHGHQLVVAAPARHADAPRDPRDVGPQPGHRA